MAKNRSKELTQALSYLITSQPFIAVLLMDLLEIVEVSDDHHVERAATDNKHIFIRSSWFNKLSTPEAVFVLAHEVLHVAYQHIPRGKEYADRGIGPDFRKYSHTRMNKATDYVINGTLSESNIGKMPLEGLHNPNIGSANSADDVYCDLPYEEDDPNAGAAGFDDHLDPAVTHSKGAIQRAVTSAANAARAQGNLPAGLERLAGEITDPKQDWKELMRDFMVVTMGHDEATWSRLNRRKLAVAPHIAFPGTQGHKSGNVAIVVDTSGSIGADELAMFLGEVSGIMGQAAPQECKIFWTDTVVAGIDEIDEYTDMSTLTSKGGGGTDMEAAFPVIDKEFNGDVDCCIVLTDLYTSINNANEPHYPVMWCSTTDNEASYGQTIHLN
jgi:predicted metal-dependent peptidase